MSPRKSHSSCIIGRQMLVYGGVDDRQKYLNDVWVLDLISLKWISGEVHNEVHKEGVGMHQMCGVYHPLKKYNLLYRNEELKG